MQLRKLVRLGAIPAAIAITVVLAGSPAQARWFVSDFRAEVTSGRFDDGTQLVTRHVRAGQHVVFDFLVRGHGQPRAKVFVAGCAGSSRFDLTYLLQQEDGSVDITHAVKPGGRYKIGAGPTVSAHVLLVVDVGNDVPAGTEKSCNLVVDGPYGDPHTATAHVLVA
jgi:hypothetical protein